MLGLESDRLLDTAHIQTSPGLTIRFGFVPGDPAHVSDFCSDHGRKTVNADLVPGPQVERSVVIVLFSGEKDALRGVLDIEEFPRGCSVTPQDNLRCSCVPGFHAFSDES